MYYYHMTLCLFNIAVEAMAHLVWWFTMIYDDLRWYTS